MLKHIVAFSAKNPNNIAAIKAGLEMLGHIPGVENFSVRENMKLDKISVEMMAEEMDVVMYVEFASIEDLESFKQHQIYAKCIDVVRPLRDKRIVLDF